MLPAKETPLRYKREEVGRKSKTKRSERETGVKNGDRQGEEGKREGASGI